MRNFKYIVRYEDMISRIPGLFSYIEDNELGVNELHKATDSLQGCYGKVIQNIIINGDRTYTYREMMEKYYSEYDELEDSFKKFVEKGIGKIQVDETINGDLVPKYIYLANARGLYNEYVKLSKLCDFYQTRLDAGDKEDPHMCCECERFERMGGNDMIDWLKKKINEAEEIATEYLEYADMNNQLNISFKINLTTSINDLGIVTPYIEEWIAGKRYYNVDKVYYNNLVYTANKETVGFYNEVTEVIEFPFNDFDEDSKLKYKNIDNTFVLKGNCDGKLKSLRRYVEYLNVYDEMETPDKDKDWLFYYRKGMVLNIETMNDEFGNIMMYKDGNPDEIEEYDGSSGDGSRLYAYGDVITDITVDENSNKIVFEYWINAHLKATFVTSEPDDDGNNHYFYSDFELDAEDTHGVKYVSEYYYENGSELYRLINDEMKINDIPLEFEKYVSGEYDNGNGGNVVDLHGKYEFSLYNNSFTYKKRIGYEYMDVYTDMSEFETVLKNEHDVMNTDIFKYDYYNGISFAPKKDIDVYIERGITSAFEKHIKFSEVKTLDDMETYANGSMFNMISDS